MASSIGSGTIPPKPHQPRHFPSLKKSFGKNKPVLRAFQASWFDKWSFLHYDQASDWVVCHTCVLEELKSANADPAFVSFLSANLFFFLLTIECKAM